MNGPIVRKLKIYFEKTEYDFRNDLIPMCNKIQVARLDQTSFAEGHNTIEKGHIIHNFSRDESHDFLFVVVANF